MSITVVREPRHCITFWANGMKFTLYFFNIHFNIMLDSTPPRTHLFPSGFLTEVLLAALRICPVRATCPTYIIPLNVFNVIIFCAESKLWSYSCALASMFIFLPLCFVEIFLLFSQRPSIYVVSLRWDVRFHKYHLSDISEAPLSTNFKWNQKRFML